MENALKAKPGDFREQYGRPLKTLQEASRELRGIFHPRHDSWNRTSHSEPHNPHQH